MHTKSCTIRRAALTISAFVVAASCGGDVANPAGPPDPSKLDVGATSRTVIAQERVVPTVRLSNGAPLTEPMTLATSNERVAGVRGDSIVGRAQGTATITITSGARSATIDVTVPADFTVGSMGTPLDSMPRVASVFDHDKPHEFTDTNGYLLSFWGEHMPGIDGHNGYDWIVPQGTAVRAVASGLVVSAGPEQPAPCPVLNNAIVSGNWIVIAHAARPSEMIYTQYGHFSRVDVKAGDRVKAGQQIGLSGSTGCSTGPHLHFSAYRLSGNESTPHPGAPLSLRLIDPYGWSAPQSDPWALDAAGIESLALWSGSQAASLYGETLFPGGAVVLPKLLRYWGIADETHPNNEYLDLFVPGVNTQDVSGWTITNTAGDRYTFSAGTVIRPGSSIRLYTGPGANNASTFYWGRSSGVWNNAGDCVTARDANATKVFAFAWGFGVCPGAAAQLLSGSRVDARLPGQVPTFR